MVETYTRRRVIIDRIETETHKGVMAVRYRPANSGKKDVPSHFISVKDFKAFWKTHPKWNMVNVIRNIKPIYHYYGGVWNALLKALASGTEDMFKVMEKAVRYNALGFVASKGFDKTKLLRFENSSHTFYPFEKDMPMSMPYHFGYIGGISNTDFDLDMVEKILRKNKTVSNVKRIEIPYYNAHDDHTHAVEFSVQLPQKDHDKLVRYWRDKRKADYWEGRLKEGLVHYWHWNSVRNHKRKIICRGAPDLLGLKKALKKDKKS